MQTLHLKSIIQNPSGDRATPRPFHPYTFLRHPFLGPLQVTRNAPQRSHRIPHFAFRINPTMNLSWKRTLRRALIKLKTSNLE
jgi:hypothetical protein